MDSDKKAVEEFWDKASCGEDLYLQNQHRDGYVEHARRSSRNSPNSKRLRARTYWRSASDWVRIISVSPRRGLG